MKGFIWINYNENILFIYDLVILISVLYYFDINNIYKYMYKVFWNNKK